MKHLIKLTILVMALIPLFAFSENTGSIVPKPVRLQPKEGRFQITDQTVIVVNTETQSLGKRLQSMLSPAMGFDCRLTDQSGQNENIIALKLDKDLHHLGTEGYTLSVKPEKIVIQAPDEPGLFYGLVSLKQLLGPDIYRSQKAPSAAWYVPCVEIEDAPKFRWRGMHLDVCRHFMPVEFVKKYIDLLALHKLNTFHWHLTEDQGWRVEIKKYPKLTEISAWRKETVIGRNSGQYDGTPHGGFYTQDQIRDVVEYAKQRYITVVPEIEMPGHSVAVLAAYPQLSCTGGPFEVYTRWGVSDDVFCAGNDQVFEFLKDVLAEVMDLFPGEYIHIGGDECPKTRWKDCPKCQKHIKAEGLKDEHELQSWFIKQIDGFLTEHGRRLIGWDEILEGGLAPGATVMSWRGEDGGIKAAQAGHDVVMAPNSHMYFDHYQVPENERDAEPLAFGGFTSLEKVYGYNPVPAALTQQQQKHILGAQAQVWTEYILDASHVEYMALPRMCALAEVVWTPAEQKDYDDFYNRLEEHTRRLKMLDVNFHPLK